MPPRDVSVPGLPATIDPANPPTQLSVVQGSVFFENGHCRVSDLNRGDVFNGALRLVTGAVNQPLVAVDAFRPNDTICVHGDGGMRDLPQDAFDAGGGQP